MTSTGLQGRKILVVDDDFGCREAAALDLQHEGAIVTETDSYQGFMDHLKTGEHIDAVLTDYNLKQSMKSSHNGDQVMFDCEARGIPVILWSGYAQGHVERKIQATVRRFLPKDHSVVQAFVDLFEEEK
jgi:CheY-like chemotaxis protein